MNARRLVVIAVVGMVFCAYSLTAYPIVTLKAIAFTSVSAFLAYLALSGFRLITRSALKEMSVDEVKKLVCNRSGLRRFSVCFSGIDGSGKSSQAYELARYLRTLGFKAEVVWGRWPAFSSYLVLGVGKLLGFHKKTKEPSGYVRVIPHYHAQGPLAKMYILSMLFDIHLWYIRAKIMNFRSNIIIFDRFILDILTDLAYETGEHFVKEFGGLAKIYIASAKKLDLSIIFDLDPQLAYKRKVDVSLSELQIKRELFNLIALKSGAHLIDASQRADQIADQILRMFRERLES